MDLIDLKIECRCGTKEFEESNGFYYCVECGQKVEGMQETGLGDEADVYNGTYSQYRRRAAIAEPVPQTQSEFWTQLTQQPKSEVVEMKPYVPADFGSSSISSEISSEDYAYELRTTYVMGIELMIEYQCQALVEEFGVSPLICGLTGVILLRFVVASQVFDENWASRIVDDSEMQIDEDVKVSQPRSQMKNEPRNIGGKRLLMIWLRSLRKTFPLSLSLSICYLACHIAREPVLPTDMVMWALGGKLPFLNAFERIGKLFGNPSPKCPLSTDVMFRPFKIFGWRELESQAGYIAECIGLELPPVNFNALARRYLKQLQLPQEEILQKASMIHEWAMPPDLWLSSSSGRIPSRVCVMSIIVVAIRIMYNINGHGKWEKKYCSTPISSRKRKQRVKVGIQTKKKTVLGSSYFLNSKLDAAELLGGLELTYEKIRRAQETSLNLQSYLKLCRETVFAAPSDNKETIIVENLWKPFQKGCTSNNAAGEPMPTQDDVSVEPVRNRSLNRLISNMKENGIYYIPPRNPRHVNNVNYLHYEMKNVGGTRILAAHADYYILLRVCALVAEADVEYMHKAILKFEKRLDWLEKNIDRTLKPSSVPDLGILSLEDDDEALELSEDKPNLVEDSPPYMDMDDSLDFSNYKFGL